MLSKVVLKEVNDLLMIFKAITAMVDEALSNTGELRVDESYLPALVVLHVLAMPNLALDLGLPNLRGEAVGVAIILLRASGSRQLISSRRS